MFPKQARSGLCVPSYAYEQHNTSLHIVGIMEKYDHIQTGLEKNTWSVWRRFFRVYTTPYRFGMVSVCMASFCIEWVCMVGGYRRTVWRRKVGAQKLGLDFKMQMAKLGKQ